MQKLIIFLNTSHEQSKKIIPFIIESKRRKYLGINLTKEMQDLSIENYKTLLKEIKEDSNKWKDILCLWTGKLNIVMSVIFPKLIYRFSAIPFKIPIAFLAEMEKLILKVIMLLGLL